MDLGTWTWQQQPKSAIASWWIWSRICPPSVSRAHQNSCRNGALTFEWLWPSMPRPPRWVAPWGSGKWWPFARRADLFDVGGRIFLCVDLGTDRSTTRTAFGSWLWRGRGDLILSLIGWRCGRHPLFTAIFLQQVTQQRPLCSSWPALPTRT